MTIHGAKVQIEKGQSSQRLPLLHSCLARYGLRQSVNNAIKVINISGVRYCTIDGTFLSGQKSEFCIFLDKGNARRVN